MERSQNGTPSGVGVAHMYKSDWDIETAFWSDMGRWSSEPLRLQEPTKPPIDVFSDSHSEVDNSREPDPTEQGWTVERSRAQSNPGPADSSSDSLGQSNQYSVHEFVISLVLTAMIVVGPAAVVLCAQPELDEVVAMVRSLSASTEQ
jgi:hypothetical protein